MPPDQFPAPTRRADAERNRDKILGAARAAFATSDAQVSMAEISRLAGVGMATLYRNFPGASPRGSRVQHTGMCGVVSRRPIRPAVARMVMASSIPRAVVAMSGIV